MKVFFSIAALVAIFMKPLLSQVCHSLDCITVSGGKACRLAGAQVPYITADRGEMQHSQAEVHCALLNKVPEKNIEEKEVDFSQFMPDSDYILKMAKSVKGSQITTLKKREELLTEDHNVTPGEEYKHKIARWDLEYYYPECVKTFYQSSPYTWGSKVVQKDPKGNMVKPRDAYIINFIDGGVGKSSNIQWEATKNSTRCLIINE